MDFRSAEFVKQTRKRVFLYNGNAVIGSSTCYFRNMALFKMAVLLLLLRVSLASAESHLTSHGCATPERPDSPASDYGEYECVPPTPISSRSQPPSPSPAPSVSGISRLSAAKRKIRNSISDIASVMTQVHEDEIRLQERLQERQERQHLEHHEQLERHHEQQNIYNNQYLQHLHEVAANTWVGQEQDAAFRREELTETATFNQSFLTQFGRLVDALSGRRV